MDLRRDARIVVVAALAAAGVPGVAIAQAPADSYYNFLMGRHLEGDGKGVDALNALERASAADPKSAEIRAEIASLQYRRNLRDESEKAAKQALALDDRNFEANRVLGLLYANAAANDLANAANTVESAASNLGDAAANVADQAGDMAANAANAAGNAAK